MIQLNLLPDVKLEYIKAQKLRSLVMGGAIIVSSIAIVILVALLLFDFAQKQRISSLNGNIATSTNTLESKSGISNILTVQNQLESLTALHEQKPAVSRLFDTYLNEITPVSVSLDQLNTDFTQNTATLTGTADSLTTVNEYVDTLKLTTYTAGNSKVQTPAFTNVVLTSFGINSNPSSPDQAASFTINLDFSKTIFNITSNVKLTVPSITTTRSETASTSDLFTAAPVTSTGGK